MACTSQGKPTPELPPWPPEPPWLEPPLAPAAVPPLEEGTLLLEVEGTPPLEEGTPPLEEGTPPPEEGTPPPEAPAELALGAEVVPPPGSRGGPLL